MGEITVFDWRGDFWFEFTISLIQGRDRRLTFSYLDHPAKSGATSGLNWASRLVSQSEKMAFRFGKIFFYFQTIRFVSFQTEGRKMLQPHFFDFRRRTFAVQAKYYRLLQLPVHTREENLFCSKFWQSNLSLPANLGTFWRYSTNAWREAKSATCTDILSFLKIRMSDKKSIEEYHCALLEYLGELRKKSWQDFSVKNTWEYK